MRQIKRIFVHCTAGPQTQTVEQIKKYWKNVNKWTNPGYHYIIKPDGEIVQLQPEDKPSNGVAGYNSTSINVCYIGGVDKQGRAVDNRTDAQKASLLTILKELKTRYPDAEILGHREIWGDNPKNWKKMCPCFSAKTEYADIMKEDVTEETICPSMGPDIIEIPEDEPISEPDSTGIQEVSTEGQETCISGKEDEEQPKEDNRRPSILDFIAQILTKIFSYVFKRK